MERARGSVERDKILRELIAHNLNYMGTARALGISRATLFNKIRKIPNLPQV